MACILTRSRAVSVYFGSSLVKEYCFPTRHNGRTRMPFQEYKTIVGSTAAVVTAAMTLSPAFLCKKVINQGTADNVDPTPMIGGMGMAILFFQHGLLLNDSPMIFVNVLGIFLNLIYIAIFFVYTQDKEAFKAKTKQIVGFALILILYAQIDQRISHERTVFIFSIITTLANFTLIGAPLMEVKSIIANKNADKLPFPIILSGSCVCSLWLLYAIIIENVALLIQNIVAFTLVSVQLFLCFKYSSPPKESIDKSKKID